MGFSHFTHHAQMMGPSYFSSSLRTRTSATSRWVLSPSPGDWRIPAGKLRSAVNGFAAFSFLDHFQGCLVLGLKTHHQSCAKQYPSFITFRDHFFNFFDNHAQWLFTENVLTSFCASNGLFVMQVCRSSNISRLNIQSTKLPMF